MVKNKRNISSLWEMPRGLDHIWKFDSSVMLDRLQYSYVKGVTAVANRLIKSSNKETVRRTCQTYTQYALTTIKDSVAWTNGHDIVEATLIDADWETWEKYARPIQENGWCSSHDKYFDENGWQVDLNQYFEDLSRKRNIHLHIDNELVTAAAYPAATNRRYDSLFNAKNQRIPLPQLAAGTLKLLKVAYECADQRPDENEAKRRALVLAENCRQMAVLASLDAQQLLLGYPHCLLSSATPMSAVESQRTACSLLNPIVESSAEPAMAEAEKPQEQETDLPPVLAPGQSPPLKLEDSAEGMGLLMRLYDLGFTDDFPAP